MKLFRDISPSRRAFNLFAKPSRFVARDENGFERELSFDELSEWLNVTDSRADFYLCLGNARALQKAGDLTSWIEYPSGNKTRLPA